MKSALFCVAVVVWLYFVYVLVFVSIDMIWLVDFKLILSFTRTTDNMYNNVL